MLKIKIILFFFFTTSLILFGQTVDSFPETKNIITDKQNADTNFTCNSYDNFFGNYRSRCYFKTGKKHYRGNRNIFRVLHSKTWDEEGKLIRKSKTYPFGSTSYTQTCGEKTYDVNGHLIKYEFTKDFISCFRSPKIIRRKIVEYDDKGNITKWSKQNKNRVKCGKSGIL